MTDSDRYRDGAGSTSDAEPLIPNGPIHRDVFSHLPEPTVLQALLDELDDIELGAHDRAILTWLTRWEFSTVVVFISLLRRVRAAGART
jgi:hypothetical protein